MKYLLDTNICIYLIKNHPPQVLESFQRHSLSDVAISSITVYELEYGVAKSQQQRKSAQALTKFLNTITIIDVDKNSAEQAAKIRAVLERKGTPIGPYDLLIAGQALAQNLILITNNVREFDRIQELTVENWVSKE